MKSFLFLTALLLVSCSSHDKDDQKSQEKTVTKARSDIHSPGEKVKGTLEAMEENDKIRLKVKVSGLKPNSKHGFHIHENGVCEGPDFKSAGSHLNPYKMPHGSPHMKTHLGDLGNLEANAKGVAEKEITIQKHQPDDFRQIVGKAVIVHEKADDLKTQPTGDSGGRIGCGIIKPI